MILLALSGAQPTSAQTVVEYIHTDALGSVVAVTDASGHVIERREYEPYGAQLAPAVQDGPGYTRHVQDAATGLVYMQQRYYDPVLGVFLSVDPVAAHENLIDHFHRYRYANNNPYNFTDPDGRQSRWLMTPRNFNVSHNDITRARVQPQIDAANRAVAPKAVTLTGTVGNVAGGSGLAGGAAQGPSGTVMLGVNGVETTGSWGSARADTMAGSANLLTQQATGDQILGAHAQLADVSIGVSSLQTLAEASQIEKSTLTTPVGSVSWGNDGKGGWNLEVGGGAKGGLSFTKIEPEKVEK